MDVLEFNNISSSSNSFMFEPLQENKYTSGWILRLVVGLGFILYGLIAFVLKIKMGFYAIKILILLLTSLLLLNPPSYPFLLGLLIPIYYYLKPSQYAEEIFSYVAHYTSVMVILMAVFYWFWQRIGENRRNIYQHMDLLTLCFTTIFICLLVGRVWVANPYLYFSRIIDITAFICALYLGRSCLNISLSIKQLLFGLALSIFAFELPFSVGYVLQQGIGVMGRLDQFRGEMGAAGVGSESGTVLVAFALAYSLSSSGFSIATRRIAMWLVAIPAGLVIMIFLSKGAIILLPVTVFLNLLFSGRRRAATIMAFVSVFFIAMLYIMVPQLFLSFEQRMKDISHVAEGRQNLRMQAVTFALSNPLLGIGACQFRTRTEFYSAHNEELNILAEHGAIALIMYVLMWVYMGYMVLKLRISRNMYFRSWAGIFLVMMIVYFLYMQIQPMYFERGGLLFMYCMGIMASLYHESQSIASMVEYTTENSNLDGVR